MDSDLPDLCDLEAPTLRSLSLEGNQPPIFLTLDGEMGMPACRSLRGGLLGKDPIEEVWDGTWGGTRDPERGPERGRERGRQQPQGKALEPSFPRRDPPQVPAGYLEPSYHRYLRPHVDPLETLRFVLAHLTSVQVDCVINPDSFKIKAVHYVQGTRIPFYVRVFTNTGVGQYALEFQRRSGDVVAFNELYRGVIRVLDERELLAPAPALTPAMTPALMPVPHLLPVDQGDYRQTIECLHSMVRSPFIDVKIQALSGLLEVSSCAREVMVEEGVVETILEILATDGAHEDVFLPAVTALARLSAGSDDVCKRVMVHPSFDRIVSRESSSSSLQTTRECLQILINIVARIPAYVLDAGVVARMWVMVRLYRDSPDPTIRARSLQVEAFLT